MMKGILGRLIHRNESLLSMAITAILAISLVLMSPEKGAAVGDFHLYGMPGVWAQDMETGWVSQTHLRYLTFDETFGADGEDLDPGFEMNSVQLFAKLAHVERLSEKVQLTNVVIATLAANMDMDVAGGNANFDTSVSGAGDVISTNYIGRWWKDRSLHTAIGFSLKLPFGDYDADQKLNIGENRYVLYLPCLFFQYRKPIGDGMFFLDYAMDLEWRFENNDIHYDDHDTAEFSAIFTYFTSRECKYGFFIQPCYQIAINESEQDGVKQNDGDFYTFGTGLGFVWNIKPGRNLNIKWTREWDGRELNNGMYAPQIDAIHFMWTYAF